MTRRKTYEVVLHVSANDSDVALLHVLEVCTGGVGIPVKISARDLAQLLGIRPVTVRRSACHLANQGLVVMGEVRRADGGRDANSYMITTAGGAFLHSPEASALIAAMRPIRVPSAYRVGGRFTS